MQDRRDLPPRADHPNQMAGYPSLTALPLFVWLIAFAVAVLGLSIHRSGLNVTWLTWAHAHTVLPDFFWANVTLLGFGWAVLIVVTAFDRGHGRSAMAALLAVLMGGVLIAFFKRAMHHPRPSALLDSTLILVIGEPIFSSGSMPSGHAAGAAAMATLLALAWRDRGQLGKTRLLALVLLGLGAAWSRVAVGAHWPADVLVGASLGLAMAWAAHRLVNVWMPTKLMLSAANHKHRMWWLCTLELVLAAVCFGTDTGQPLAVWFQGFLGVLAIVSCLVRLRVAVGLKGA